MEILLSILKNYIKKASAQRNTTSSASSNQSGSSKSKQLKEFYCEICYLASTEDVNCFVFLMNFVYFS